MIAEILVSISSIASFILAVFLLKVTQTLRFAVVKAQDGALVVLDRNLDDDEKEIHVRAAALSLFGLAFHILLKFAICLGAAAVPIFAAEWLGWVSVTAVTTLMLRWDYILATTAILITAGWVYRYYRGDSKSLPESNYSDSDQFLHRFAFSSPGFQMSTAILEDRLFSRKISATRDKPPVFVTALPRAGTTILLTALNDFPEFATHTYRDMPFVMSPLLWNLISRKFRKRAQLNERAHGDGIQIGFDSPEAFEEILWRHFWPDKYRKDRIELWDPDDASTEITNFFTTHFRKIIALRTDGKGRYLSKNNNNIARIPLIQTMFPDATIVVPIRNPAEHAASLLRQHKNFHDLHSSDPFAKRYMEDIGHLEFGHLQRPIAFPGALENPFDPQEPNYWLSYWISAYTSVLESRPSLSVVTLETISESPAQVMSDLCSRLQVDVDGLDLRRHFRPIRSKADRAIFDEELLRYAGDIYEQFRERGI
jgi:hypothetical protein